MTFSDHPTYTGRGLLHENDRRTYNAEARRIGSALRVCEYCGLETRSQCRQRDGGAPGWFENKGTVSCGPCRCTELVSGAELRTLRKALLPDAFTPEF